MKAVFQLVKEALLEWFNSNSFELGAALAYYGIFALAPTLVIALAIAGMIFGPGAAEGHLQSRLEQIVGPTIAPAIESTLKYAHTSGGGWWATLVGVVVLIFGAIGAFSQLQSAVNTLWGIKARPGRGVLGVLADRLFSFLVMLCVGILLVLSLAASAVLTAVVHFLPREQLPGGLYLWEALRWVISFALLTGLFAVIYRVLPDAKIPWRCALIGGALTAVLFTIGNYLIGLYLGRSSVTSAYGAAGSLVIILLWFYYSSQIVLFGAVFTKLYVVRYCGYAIRPTDNAVALASELGLQSAESDRRQAVATPSAS